MIAAQETAIDEQQATISELQARVERPERLVSRNSGNASFPPSMDGQPGRRRPARAKSRYGPRVASVLLVSGRDGEHGHHRRRRRPGRSR